MLLGTRSFTRALLFCLATAPLVHAAEQALNTQFIGEHPGRAAPATSAFNTAKQNPLQLHAFLFKMPKGADLHTHLSGAVYAETFIRDAAIDHLCINTSTLSFVKEIGVTRNAQPQSVCGEGTVRADSAFTDQHLYDGVIDSFSMSSFVPSAGVSGHDQFFATFARFSGLNKSHIGEWVDELAARAASQNEQYLEIMQTPTFSNAARLGYSIDWPGASDPNHEVTAAELAKLRDELLAKGLRDEVIVDSTEFDEALATRRRIENCDQPAAAAACSVKVRFLGQVLRGFPPQQVFAQTLLYF